MAKGCIDFAIQAETVGFQLEDIQNLFLLFWEHFASETERIDPKQPYTSAVFLARLPMAASLFTAATTALVKAGEELKAATDEAYAAVKNEKNGASADVELEQLVNWYNAADTRERKIALAVVQALCTQP